ncbi:MAG: RNA polymerase sigma factor [Desulfatiglandaceae bacterium]|jgi:RNA polymerase sigma-70 factor (ECF subfamily)
MMHNDSGNSGDAQIVGLVLGGNVNAFETLMLRYTDHVLRIVKRHVNYEVVEETAHEVFVRAFQSLSNFKNSGNFRQWLSSIAVRTCYDYWRKVYRSREIPMSQISDTHREWLEEILSDRSGQSFDEKGAQEEAREVLDWALERLPAGDRMVLELVHLEGLSSKEAADLLGWSVANVKVRSFRARKKLQKLLCGLINDRGGRL